MFFPKPFKLMLKLSSTISLVGFNGPKSALHFYHGLQRVWAMDCGG